MVWAHSDQDISIALVKVTLDQGSGDDLRLAAIPAVMLLRQTALRRSVATPEETDGRDSELHQVSVFDRLWQKSRTVPDDALTDALGWTRSAWLGGDPGAARGYPVGLLDLVAPQSGNAPVMIRVAAQAELAAALAGLADEVNRLSSIDAEICQHLIGDPSTTVRTQAALGVFTDAGLLGHTPEQLLNHANTLVSEPILPQARRWPLLLWAVEQVQRHVRRIMELASLAPLTLDLSHLDTSGLQPFAAEIIRLAVSWPPEHDRESLEAITRLALRHSEGRSAIAALFSGVGLDDLLAQADPLPPSPTQTERMPVMATSTVDTATAATTATHQISMTTQEMQRREHEAKRLYEAGQVDAALAELNELLAQAPRSPGAFLLLRICREQVRLPEAQRAVEVLARAKFAKAIHFKQLARVAAAANKPLEVHAAMDQALRLGASTTEIDELAQLLKLDIRAASLQPSLDLRTAAQQGTLSAEDWAAHVGTELALPNRRDNLLAVARDIASDLTVPILFKAMGSLPNGEDLRESFLEGMAAAGGFDGVLAVAAHLQTAGDHADAVRLLRKAEARMRPSELPQLWFVLRGAMQQAGYDLDNEQVPWLRLPARPWREHAEAAGTVPPIWLPNQAFPATAPEILRRAQLTMAEHGAAAAAPLWREAVVSGHTAALPTAVGSLVAAGHPDQAIELYEQLEETAPVRATTAWNFGCALAALRYPLEAALAFEYHAKVSSRSYLPDEETSLVALFALVERPVPRLAGQSSHASRRPNPVANRKAAANVAVEKFRKSPTSALFVEASTQLRAATAGKKPEQRKAALDEIERLFHHLRSPSVNAYAELIRALIAAGEVDRAWTAAVSTLGRKGPAQVIISHAMVTANTSERREQLRQTLESHCDPGSYRVFLALSKLAQQQLDAPSMELYATAALELKPDSTEAKKLVRESRRLVGGAVGKTDVLDKFLERHRSHPMAEQAIAELAEAFRGSIAGLRSRMGEMLAMRFEEENFGHQLLPETEPLAKAGMAATLIEDWHQAVAELIPALELQPRNLGLVRATVIAMVKAGRIADAKALAESISYDWRGRVLLAQIAFSQGEHTEAEAHLLRLGRSTLHEGRDYAVARAGILLHHLHRNLEAAQVLLEVAEAQLPGRSVKAAAQAAVLAYDERSPDLTRAALTRLFAPAMTSAEAADWAISRDRLEALHAKHAPVLRIDDLKRLTAHFGQLDRERVYRFLKTKADNASGQTQTILMILAELQEQDGLIGSAFDTRLQALTGAPSDRRVQLEGLLEFCARTHFDEGFETIAQRAKDYGIEVELPDESEATERRDMAVIRARTFQSRLESALFRLQQARAHASLTRSFDAIDDVIYVLKGLTEGSGAAPAVAALSELWKRSCELLAGLVTTPDDERLRDEFLKVTSQIRRSQAGLGSQNADDAASAVGRELYQRWEGIARAARKAVDVLAVSIERATRVPDGPLEVVVSLTARQDVGSIRVRACNTSIEVGVLAQGEKRTVGVAGMSGEADAQLSVSFHANGIRDEVQHSAKVKRIVSDVDSEFKSGSPALGRLFIGREDERADFRLWFGRAHSGNAKTALLTGPREVGKTSLMKSLLADPGKDPATWPIPRVLPIYLETSDIEKGSSIYEWIVDEIEHLLGRLSAHQHVPAGFPRFSGTSTEARHVLRWLLEVKAVTNLGFLVILDEVQKLLGQLQAESVLERVMNGFRSLTDGGGFALVLCGSVPGLKIERMLGGSLVTPELRRVQLGFLSQADAFRVFDRGFVGTAHVLPEALDAMWDLTSGYPNHIHLIGEMTVDILRRERRRVVTGTVVREVGHRIGNSNAATQEIINLDGEGPSGQELLNILVSISQGAPEICRKTELARVISARHHEEFGRYLTIGLLKDDGDHYCWANELINVHVRQFIDRLQPVTTREDLQLKAAGYDTMRTLTAETALTRQVTRDDVSFVAKRVVLGQLPADAVDAQLLESVAEHVDRQLSELDQNRFAGVPAYHSRYGDWFLFEHAGGRSIAEQLLQHREIHVDSRLSVGHIAAACDVLATVYARSGITHGNLKPGNIVIDGSNVMVIDWGRGSWRGRASPIGAGTDGYMSPGYRGRLNSGGARPTDDVFALGVILYQLLHSDGRLPYGTDYVETAQPLPVDNLLAAVTMKAINPHDAERFPTPEAFAEQLRFVCPPSLQEPHVSIPPGPISIINVTGSTTGPVAGNGNISMRDNTVSVQSGRSDLQSTLDELAELVQELRAHLSPVDAAALGGIFGAFQDEAKASGSTQRDTLDQLGSQIIRTADVVESGVKLMDRFGKPVAGAIKHLVELVLSSAS